jgi:hypothetical protein
MHICFDYELGGGLQLQSNRANPGQNQKQKATATILLMLILPLMGNRYQYNWGVNNVKQV